MIFACAHTPGRAALGVVAASFYDVQLYLSVRARNRLAP